MWNEGWSVRYTMTVVSLVASKLVRRCRTPHERPVRSGYATAPQPVVRGCLVTTSPVECRLPADCSSVSTGPRGRTAATHAAYGE